ncbi:hypothetical protein GCM10011584_00740 [Nocardioides phosphati]|uniref:Uncharacterized protein n=1 Tax=Nocardioides phosphati TaxID=1867775 RepID=A0ABQ2N709_9ACTN|nr:hypothetical protein [Nocardioides phosphati]GGO84065.1 hypothetical protein GCM10011584_00740 [Nocardioides phosphati]
MTTLNGRYPAIQGEYEDEFEAEDEAFFGGLAKIAGSLLGEGEEEYEDEYEEEYEDEAFLGGIAKIAGSLLGEGEYEDESEYEFEFEAEAEAELEAEGELEAEFEAEMEEEAEGFVNPVRRVYRDAELMAHFATKAAQSESEAEAEAFIGALVPLAAKLIPRAAKLIQANGPALVRGASQIARRMRRSPQGRQLVKALPVVLQRTAQSLADQAANGRPIDATTVIGTLGDMTGRVLRGGGRRRAVQAVDVFNRRYHRRRRWQAGRAAYGPRRTRRAPAGYRQVPRPRRMNAAARRGGRGARRY